MNIGEFKLRGDRLLGSIATRTIDLPRLGLRPVQSNNPMAPVFEIVALNVGNRWVQLGALWEATSKKTGEAFLQGSIDDPCLAEPLPIALFGDDEEGYRVAWRRPQPRDDFASGGSSTPRDYAPRQDGQGGFGMSTAGEGGSLVDGPSVDEDVPF